MIVIGVSGTAKCQPKTIHAMHAERLDSAVVLQTRPRLELLIHHSVGDLAA